jgi:hypothetical protein
MKKWLVVLESNCADPNREQEFNDWYNNIHLPDLLKLPGVVRARRYKNPNPPEGEASYLALYEVEVDDIEAALAEADKYAQGLAEQGRMSELLHITRNVFYELINSQEK